MKDKQSGFILITTLIFVIILTSLILSVADSSLLEIKMNNYFNNKMIAEVSAESALTSAESKLSGKDLIAPTLGAQVSVELVQKESDPCQGIQYLIDVNSSYLQAQANLQSMMQVPPPVLPPSCHGGSITSTQLLWWQN